MWLQVFVAISTHKLHQQCVTYMLRVFAGWYIGKVGCEERRNNNFVRYRDASVGIVVRAAERELTYHSITSIPLYVRTYVLESRNAFTLQDFASLLPFQRALLPPPPSSARTIPQQLLCLYLDKHIHSHTAMYLVRVIIMPQIYLYYNFCLAVGNGEFSRFSTWL